MAGRRCEQHDATTGWMTARSLGSDAVKAGDQAPDFEALDDKGKKVTLTGLLEDGPVVLFFYPKAMTAGCTKESCHFRDLAAEFAEVGAQRVGISGDSVDRQAAFSQKHTFDFPLLSDSDNAISKAYDVKRPGPLGLRRKTFVIDRDGTILDIIASEIAMDLHADKSLEVLRNK